MPKGLMKNIYVFFSNLKSACGECLDRVELGDGGEKSAEAPHGVGTLSVKTSPSLEAGRPFQVKHCCTIFFAFWAMTLFHCGLFFIAFFWSDRLHFIAAEQALKVLEKFFLEPLKNHLNGGLFFPQPLISPCNLHFLHLHLHCQMLQFALFVSPW